MYLFFFVLRISYHLLNDLNSSSYLNFIGIFIVPLVLYLSQMNVSIGFPIVFFFSFGLTPPGYLAFFYCSTHRNVLTGHRICFFLLFFLASIVSIGLPARPALLSLRLCLDSVCPLSISNHILDLTRLLFVFSLFSSSPLLCLLVPESLWIFLIKLPRFLLFLSLYI